MLDEKGLIQSVRLHNFLSFGPKRLANDGMLIRQAIFRRYPIRKLWTSIADHEGSLFSHSKART
jgi:hypothetical protein